jgi:hypothetical protein
VSSRRELGCFRGRSGEGSLWDDMINGDSTLSVDGKRSFSEDSITHFRVVAGLGWTQWEKKVGTDEIRTREVSHHGLVST